MDAAQPNIDIDCQHCGEKVITNIDAGPVVRLNSLDARRPKVRIFSEDSADDLESTINYWLSENGSVTIVRYFTPHVDRWNPKTPEVRIVTGEHHTNDDQHYNRIDGRRNNDDQVKWMIGIEYLE